MRKYLHVISALVLGFFCLGVISNSSAQLDSTSGALIPKVISKEEAAKKYPPGGKGYAVGVFVPTNTGGYYRSPYSRSVYDCRARSCPNCGRGALILDESVNKVFVIPQ